MNHLTDLFTDHLTVSESDHLLVVNLSDLPFVQSLAARVAHLALYNPDCDVLHAFRAAFADAPNVTVHDAIFPHEGEFSAALMEIPVSPGLGKGLLAKTLRYLRPGGRLLAAGHRELGGKVSMKNAAILAKTNLLAERDTHLIFESICGDALSIPPAWGTPWEPQTMTYDLRGTTYTVHSQPGIFSWDQLEKGAAFLIRHLDDLDLPQHGTILDAGCGYGLLGMVMRDYTQARKTVWVDKSRLAIRATQRSLPGEAVECADLTRESLPHHAPFDLIFCNPPFYDPYKNDTDFMSQFTPRVPSMLSDDGVFLVVTREVFKFDEFMVQHFPLMEVAVREEGFCIMLGRKTPRTTAQ
jgi:16S rRNA G1207 methylase RsmC